MSVCSKEKYCLEDLTKRWKETKYKQASVISEQIQWWMPAARSKKYLSLPRSCLRLGNDIINNDLIVDRILDATLSVSAWVGICHISTFSPSSLWRKPCYESGCLLAFALLLSSWRRKKYMLLWQTTDRGEKSEEMNEAPSQWWEIEEKVRDGIKWVWCVAWASLVNLREPDQVLQLALSLPAISLEQKISPESDRTSSWIWENGCNQVILAHYPLECFIPEAHHHLGSKSWL